MTFLDFAEQVLRSVKQPLSSHEIWAKGVELGLNQNLDSKGKTPAATIAARLYIDLRDNKNTTFFAVGKRPVRFGLKDFINHPLDTLAPSPVQLQKFNERDLHPILVKFVDAFHHFRGTKLCTIFHENSLKSKKGNDKWLHPDLVGVYFPFNDYIRNYEKVILHFQKDFSINVTTFFSFELKIEINRSNLREAYFQAVSNSSWANEGYLVALKIGEDVIDEARKLANSFGIGLIQLDAKDVNDGQIVVPAAYKKDVDIDAMDQLAEKNPDFAKFLKNVIEDYSLKRVKNPQEYDEVLGDDRFAEYLKQKQIL